MSDVFGTMLLAFVACGIGAVWEEGVAKPRRWADEARVREEARATRQCEAYGFVYRMGHCVAAEPVWPQ